MSNCSTEVCSLLVSAGADPNAYTCDEENDIWGPR